MRAMEGTTTTSMGMAIIIIVETKVAMVNTRIRTTMGTTRSESSPS